jgi:integrase
MLSDEIARYVALHRATGFKFKIQACLLQHYLRHATARGEDHVSAESTVAWASAAPSPRSRRDRLQVVRRFARAMAAENPRHELPPNLPFGPPRTRPRPFIFAPAQLDQLLRAAAALRPTNALRPRTFVTLFALLVATGLRVSEALALQLDDVAPAGLLVRATKFRKDRLVPIHATTRQGLEAYLAVRRRTGGSCPHVFLSAHGGALPYSTVVATFLRLVRRCGLRVGPGQPGPRIHDMRHTFAVRSLEQCRGDREAVRRHMVALSTYLGHAHISDTYWYLQATPALLRDVAAASEALARGGPQ